MIVKGFVELTRERDAARGTEQVLAATIRAAARLMNAKDNHP